MPGYGGTGGGGTENAEEWLKSLYVSSDPPGTNPLWDKALKFALAQLVRPWRVVTP